MELTGVFAILVGFVMIKEIIADIPCAAKFYDQSAVCVCNTTYCDTIIRTEPEPGTYMIYTSSKAGLRFEKQSGFINEEEPSDEDDYDKVFEIIPKVVYQTIEGFGGASTDAAGINWKSLPSKAQQYLINSYFSDVGIEFNMLRLPIASTDFSTRMYTYHDHGEYDKDLSNFTLALEDFKFKIPLIHAAKKVATDFIKIVSACWSPPIWMKEPKQISGKSTVKPEFFQTFADYHCKFAEAYKKNGIDIWAMSTTNEPMNYLMAVDFQSTVWNIPNMATYIKEYFGPTLKKCSVKGIKILSGDDQRHNIPIYSILLERFVPNTLQFIDGFAVHSYLNKDVPASVATSILEKLPEKFAIATEFCTGASPEDKLKVHLGSWDRAKEYFTDILENLNSNFVGWIDWNLCLNREGGPNWVKNFVDSPIIVDAKKKEFYKQPMFYALGHFSKFLPRGSKRMEMLEFEDNGNYSLNEKCSNEPSKEHVAFLTPRNTIVVIIHNYGAARSAVIRVSGRVILTTELEADSFTTLEIPYDDSFVTASE